MRKRKRRYGIHDGHEQIECKSTAAEAMLDGGIRRTWNITVPRGEKQ